MYGAPRLPASYFTMFCIALVPPLWRRLMDRRLDALAGARESGMGLPAELRPHAADRAALEPVMWDGGLNRYT